MLSFMPFLCANQQCARKQHDGKTATEVVVPQTKVTRQAHYLSSCCNPFLSWIVSCPCDVSSVCGRLRLLKPQMSLTSQSHFHCCQRSYWRLCLSSEICFQSTAICWVSQLCYNKTTDISCNLTHQLKTLIIKLFSC